MNLSNIFKKLRRLKEKRLSGKTAAMFLLNRKLAGMKNGGADEFGKIIDLRLDRPEKSIAIELSRNGETSVVMVKGYRVESHLGGSALSWQSMDFTGADRERYRRIFRGVDRIKIPKSTIFMLEAIL